MACNYNLRPYQSQSISELRQNMKNGINRMILCAPTGSGKTVMFSYMVSRAIENGRRCLIITDRIELISQAGGTLSNFGLQPVEIKAGKKLKSINAMLYTAMAQTLTRRMSDKQYLDLFDNLDIIIIDEGHKQSFNSILNHIPKSCYVIAATATPLRDKNQVSLHEFYKAIVEVVKISELIEAGFLATPETFGVKIDLSGIKMSKGDYDETQVAARYSETKLFHGVYENYQKLTPNKKALIFASNVTSSIELVDDFKEKGLPIEHLDANTPAPERKRILKWFKETPNAMLSNVGILNAGYDEPTIEVVILYRATKSLPLFLQMCGRGSRTIPNVKDKFTILDFGNNIREHGFWEQDRVWSLVKKKKRDGVAPVKDCPSCFALLPSSVTECKYCGHQFEKSEKQKEAEVIAELQQLSYKQIQDQIKTADFAKLEQIALAKGYKKTWIFYHLKTEEDLWAYAKFKNYHPKWVEHQIKQREEENA